MALEISPVSGLEKFYLSIVSFSSAFTTSRNKSLRFLQIVFSEAFLLLHNSLMTANIATKIAAELNSDREAEAWLD